MIDLITGLVSALFELLLEATGRQLLRLFGLKRKLNDITSMLTGMAFWIIVGVTAYVIFLK
jgi:hypothetical protein